MAVSVRAYQPEFVNKLLESAFPNAAISNTCVCVGDIIETEEQDTLLRGHGTQLVNGTLIATVCGVVERVNKLIYVRTLNSRYKAEQGDVVVGRILEVSGKSWKVELSSRQEARLLLSAVHLPGGVQRRRNAEDELNMRNLFKEGDLLSAEVQSIHGDGSVALHTRSEKYSKLKMGQMVKVPPNLIKRQKQHFHTIEGLGVDMIIGCNGLVWIAPSSDTAQKKGEGREDEDDEESEESAARPPVTRAQIENCTRFANSIRVLIKLYMPVYPTSVSQVYEASINNDVATKDMLEPEFLSFFVEQELAKSS